MTPQNPMTCREPAAAEVSEAALAIVDAFGATDGDRYFALFAPDASFVFHPEPRRLDSRAEYERIWSGWVAGGWRVLECVSSDRLVQTFPGGGVFSHTVFTRVYTGETEESYRERESIIFRVDGESLTAVHEHLSAFTTESD